MPQRPGGNRRSRRQGIIIHAGLVPSRCWAAEGKVRRPGDARHQVGLRPEGRFNPAFHDGSEKVLECDTVIMAIGQAPNLEFLQPEDASRFRPRGLISVESRKPDDLRRPASLQEAIACSGRA